MDEEKKENEVILVSGNQGKLKEFQAICGDKIKIYIAYS